MASDLNRVVLIGRLTRDSELKSTNSGTQFCRFSLASNHSQKKGDGYEDKPGFFECICWGKSAEILHKYVKKGHRLCVEGRLSWSSWESEGKTRSKVEIAVESFHFLEKKGDGQPETTGQGVIDSDAMPRNDIPF